MRLPISSWVPPLKAGLRNLPFKAGALQRFASQQVGQIRICIEVLAIGSCARYLSALFGVHAFVVHTEISFLFFVVKRSGLPDVRPGGAFSCALAASE